MQNSIWVITTVAAVIATTAEAQTNSIELPKPSGPYAVGTTTYEWTDPQRRDRHASQDNGNRRIAVQIWYPAEIEPGIQRAPYSAHSSQYKHVVTNSWLWPAFAEGLSECPLVLICPGRGVNHCAYSSIAESLASHGYVVAAVGMPEIGFVTFSDGYIARPNPDFRPSRSLMSGPYEKVDEFFKVPTELGRQDLDFILNQLRMLTEDDPDGRFTDKFDLTKIGLFGHSLGGRIAGAFAAANPTVKAYISMEGIAPRRARLEGLLNMHAAMMCSSGTLPYAKNNYQTLIDGRSQTVFMVELQKFGHNSVTDLPVIFPNRYTYEIDPGTGLRTSITVITAYFDAYLKSGSAFKDAVSGVENVVVTEYAKTQE